MRTLTRGLRPNEINWTETMINRLTTLRATGASYNDIAKAMGISKNAAVGKAGRIGLGQEGTRGCINPRDPNAPPNPQGRPHAPRVTLPALTGYVMPQPDPAAPQRVSRGDCAWLDGQRDSYRQCVEPAQRGSYCVGHAERAFLSPGGGRAAAQ